MSNAKGETRKKFRPAKQFRYLRGDVNQNVNKTDLKVYNIHKLKVFRATALVDTQPLRLDMTKWVNYRKLHDAVNNAIRIDKENKQLLKKINLIHRTTGKVDTYNPFAYQKFSQWKRHECEMIKIQRHNKDIYKRILNAQATYPTKEFLKDWKECLTHLEHSCKFPLVITKEIDIDTLLQKQPSVSCDLERGNTERPVCFLDFKVVDGEYIGRIYVELYNDHVPVTVQNFLSIIKGEYDLSYKNCPIHAIVKGRYLETGDITRGTGRGGFSIYGKTFPEENHMLKHTRAGTLSMKRIPPMENHSQFCITFVPMEQLDHKNVVFGKVVKGNRNLLKIDNYGRKIGKPYADIRISNCGEVQQQKNESNVAKSLDPGGGGDAGNNNVSGVKSVKRCKCQPSCQQHKQKSQGSL